MQGGSMFISNPIKSLMIESCNFKNNSALVSGGCISIVNEKSKEYEINIQDCSFIDSKSENKGGAIYM